MACQKEDKTLRQKIAKLLINDGWAQESAKQIVVFDPYDQNASSPFFDPEWMFGLKGGFDVVIGNPPYVSAVSMARTANMKNYFKSKYPEATGSYDLYVLFLLRTIELINHNGCYSWIIPNKFLIADYAQRTKNKLIDNGLMLSIDVSTFDVFENTSVYPIIILGKKNSKVIFEEFLLEAYTDIELSKFTKPKHLKQHKSFSDFGIKFSSGATGFEAESLKEFLSETRTSKAIPFTVSGCIDKYFYSNTNVRFMGLKLGNAFIKYSHSITDSKWNFWMQPKIVIAGMTKEIESVFVKESLALGVGVYAIYNWGIFNPLYLTGILNSKYLTYYINIKFKDKHLAGGYLAINKSTLEKLPLVESSFQNYFANVVNIMQFIKNWNDKYSNAYFFERLIDAMVYELYFPDEIKAADCEVMKHLGNLPELKDGWSDEQKLQTIEKVYKELSDPRHPVSIAMEKMKTVPEVRIIEGLD